MTTQNTNPLVGEDFRRLIDRAADRTFELGYIKGSRAYRAGERVRATAATVATRAGRVVVRALGRAGDGSQGCEAWLLRASGMAGEPGTPWQYLRAAGFEVRPSPDGAHGACLVSATGGEADFAAGTDPELVFMTHPWSGVVEVEFGGRRETIDLFSPEGGHVTVRPARTAWVERTTPRVQSGSSGPVAPRADAAEPFTPADEAFLARCAAARPVAVAVHCPRWLGISAATRNLFEHRYCVPETPAIDPPSLTAGAIERHARVLADSHVPHVVISGGDLIQHRLAARLKALRPAVTIDVLYHGSYIQLAEDYEWNVVRAWVESHRAGVVRGISTVKAGMERFFRSMGVPSALVLNLVPGETLAPPDLPTDTLHAGVWLSGASARKCPHAMLGAMSILGNCRVHAAGLDARSRQLIEFLNLPLAEFHERPLPHERLMEAVRRTHMTMYVTFSECCPMLPLESLRQGVPCLLGPVSHLFEEDRFLFERLVVPFPDRADVIAGYMRRAAEERREIVAAYAAFAPAYNRRALESARRLVEEGPTTA